MPANHRLPATLTRSLSFRFDLLAAVDERVAALRTDRSTFINGVLEHLLGLHPHPEFVGREVAFVADAERAWEDRAKELERDALIDRATKRNHRAETRVTVGGLVKRPKRGF